MSMTVPTRQQLKIINEIGRFGAISLRELFEEIKGNRGTYSPFCRIVKRLEKIQLIKAVSGDRGNKYLTLTDEGALFSQFSALPKKGDKEFYHHVITGNILRSLLTFECFKSGYIANECSQRTKKDIVPDAIVYAYKNQRQLTIAVEIEWYQESKESVQNQFCHYAKGDSHCDCIIFVTAKKTIFNFYKRALSEMIPDIRKNILLLFNENIIYGKVDHQNTTLHFRGTEEKSLMEIFA